MILSNMKKFKIEFVTTGKYVVDVRSKSEKNAIEAAKKKFSQIIEDGTHHYYEEGDMTIETVNIYDVTNTEDPFNP